MIFVRPAGQVSPRKNSDAIRPRACRLSGTIPCAATTYGGYTANSSTRPAKSANRAAKVAPRIAGATGFVSRKGLMIGIVILVVCRLGEHRDCETEHDD